MEHPLLIKAISFPLILFDGAVQCGFPSPAADHAMQRIDLNEHILINRDASYLFRVRSNSMRNIGIFDGDTIVVDRSIEPRHRHIVLAIVDEEYTVKRLHRRGLQISLLAENDDFQPIVFREGQELRIWGVVTANIRRLLDC